MNIYKLNGIPFNINLEQAITLPDGKGVAIYAAGDLLKDSGRWAEFGITSEVAPPPPPPTAAMIALNAREAAKQARAIAVQAITATTSTGKTFDGDEISQARMARAIIGLQGAADPTLWAKIAAIVTGTTGSLVPTMNWTLTDNTSVPVTLEELKEALIIAGEKQAKLWPV